MALMADSFEALLIKEIQSSVLKAVRDRNLIDISYSERPKLPTDRIRQLYANVDWDRVMDLAKSSVEEAIADKFLHSLATELATDIKQIMCNKELREDLRSVLRQKIRDGVAAIT